MSDLKQLHVHVQEKTNGWEIIELVQFENDVYVVRDYCLFKRTAPHLEERIVTLTRAWRDHWSAKGFIFAPQALAPTTVTERDAGTIFSGAIE